MDVKPTIDSKPDIKGSDDPPATQIPQGKVQVLVQLGEQQFRYAVKPTTPFKKIFDATEKQVGATPGTLRFHHGGARIRNDDTLVSIDADLDDDIEISASVEQIGGALNGFGAFAL
ncbi:uncharacterized protein EI90DRAFT_3125062 [Cantharellus anzutake]|uniref:uncharacterized protein n=1 Tax=Cantharellus anzutake TaxID=1750568 RepID=UPI0019045194|nr:uncharacterized protein EI90DRAFT_3125062 [Cantharellus anzutake]KAF8329798.1 hypothetical protein EI90DRAFT_3125062 [Cantharellus anzutake]